MSIKVGQPAPDFELDARPEYLIGVRSFLLSGPDLSELPFTFPCKWGRV